MASTALLALALALSAAAAAAAAAAAPSASSPRFVPESLPAGAAARGWRRVARATSSSLSSPSPSSPSSPSPSPSPYRVSLQFALARTPAAAAALAQRSAQMLEPFDPQQPLPQLSAEQVAAQFAAPQEGCAAAVEAAVLLASSSSSSSVVGNNNNNYHGDEQKEPNKPSLRSLGHGDWLGVEMGLEAAEALLQTEFFVWVPEEEAEEAESAAVVRAEAYSLPAELRGCVEMVGGVMDFPSPKRRGGMRWPSVAHSRALGECEWPETCGISPQVLRKALMVPEGAKGNTTNGNIQSIAEFNAGDNVSPKDLAQFQEGWGLPKQQIAKIIGKNVPEQASIEANMDLQFITGVNQGTPIWVMNNGDDSFLQYLLSVAALPSTGSPLVHSVSYGEDADTLTLPQMNRFNQELVKVQTTGVSFLFASGDYGVNCHQTPVRQVPTFPSSSPFATSIGGATCGVTKRGACSRGLETDAISGGGFSNQFPMPAYGKTAMANFVSQHTPPPAASSFNTTGRGYPDLASLSEKFEFVWRGGWSFTGGTSCAAPTVSALMSLVNDARLAAHKAPLGFLNPLIYHLGATQPDVFQDITAGPRNSQGNCEGFAPAKGWDAISGWGGINFEKFLKAAVAA